MKEAGGGCRRGPNLTAHALHTQRMGRPCPFYSSRNGERSSSLHWPFPVSVGAHMTCVYFMRAGSVCVCACEHPLDMEPCELFYGGVPPTLVE